MEGVIKVENFPLPLLLSWSVGRSRGLLLPMHFVRPWDPIPKRVLPLPSPFYDASPSARSRSVLRYNLPFLFLCGF